MENSQHGRPNKNGKNKYKKSKAEQKATYTKVAEKEAKCKIDAEAT